MLVSQISWEDLRSRLCGPGLTLQTGPFVNGIRSPLTCVARGIALLYADFPITPASRFVDFWVNLEPAQGIRRWVFPRAYFLSRGEQELPFGRFPTRLALSYLEWGLNYSIYGDSSSYLILHAAVLERGGQAVVIVGDSGAGKSTLCTALTLSGWRLLSDEMALVDLADGLISPTARPISLKSQSIATIRNLSPEATISPISWTKRKGPVAHLKPPAESVRRMDEPAMPRWIVFVRYSEGSPLTIESVPRVRAFGELLRSAFNYMDLGQAGFQRCSALVESCECHRIQYSKLTEVLAHFDSLQHGVD